MSKPGGPKNNAGFLLVPFKTPQNLPQFTESPPAFAEREADHRLRQAFAVLLPTVRSVGVMGDHRTRGEVGSELRAPRRNRSIEGRPLEFHIWAMIYIYIGIHFSRRLTKNGVGNPLLYLAPGFVCPKNRWQNVDRTYENVCVLRAVTTTDFMTAA